MLVSSVFVTYTWYIQLEAPFNTIFKSIRNCIEKLRHCSAIISFSEEDMDKAKDAPPTPNDDAKDNVNKRLSLSLSNGPKDSLVEETDEELDLNVDSGKCSPDTPPALSTASSNVTNQLLLNLKERPQSAQSMFKAAALSPSSTGHHKRQRTCSTSASTDREPPLIRTQTRTIYTAGRPPWYNTHGERYV